LQELKSPDDFSKLAAKKSTNLGDFSVVKVVYHKPTKKIYFVDMNKNEFHYDFAIKELHWQGSFDEFDQNYYAKGEREFLLGSLVINPDAPQWLLVELWENDSMNAADFREFFHAVVGHLGEGFAPPVFHPLSQFQEKMAEELDNIDVATSNDMSGDRE